MMKAIFGMILELTMPYPISKQQRKLDKYASHLLLTLRVDVFQHRYNIYTFIITLERGYLCYSMPISSPQTSGLSEEEDRIGEIVNGGEELEKLTFSFITLIMFRTCNVSQTTCII